MAFQYTVIPVPGLDYRDNGHLTGADLKIQTELLRKGGIKVHFVNIPPLGSVDGNAVMIAEAIRTRANERILIGGPCQVTSQSSEWTSTAI